MLSFFSSSSPSNRVIARYMQVFDWSASPLGPVTAWPTCLHHNVRLLLNSQLPMLMLCGEQGVVIYNQAYAELAGDRHPSLFGVTVEAVWPALAHKARLALQRALRGESMRSGRNEMHLTHNAKTRLAYFDFYCSPLLDEQQKSHGMLCHVIETTQHINALRQTDTAKARLQDTRAHLAIALEAEAVIGTWEWDVRSAKVIGDERFAKTFQFDPKHALNGLPREQCAAQIHPDDIAPLSHYMNQLNIKCERFKHNFRIKRANGAYRWVQISGYSRLTGPNSALAFAGVLFDIDEHKQTELALRQLTQNLERRVAEAIKQRLKAEEQLRQAQKMEAIGQLTGGIAHDFNNILAGILGGLELSLLKLNKGQIEEIPRLLNAAISSTQRGASLTHRLLAFARRQTLNMRTTNTNQLIESMEELISRTLGPHLVLKLNLAKEPWLIRIDPHQLENALLNLTINSRDAMPHGGTLSIETYNQRIYDSSHLRKQLNLPAGDYLRISLRDTGIGMSDDVSAHAFEPFFTTKPINYGTGLGLPMVYGLIKQADGHLQLTSAQGLGTLIDIYLPRVFNSVAEPETCTATATTLPGQGEHILLVEDDACVRLLMTQAITDLGYRLTAVDSSREALQCLHNDASYDLLLTDIGLTGLSGPELAEAARALYPTLPVLFASGYTHDAKLRTAKLQMNTALLSKPFSLEALSCKLRALLTPEPTPAASRLTAEATMTD